MGEQFVNPYTFVPLPSRAPERTPPHGHRGNPELLSGKLRVRIRTVTPLLIRGFGNENGKHLLPRLTDGRAFLPGSSLKGAVRSLHETLTGSCLRVFHGDFLPSYRSPVETRSTRQLAVVVKPGDASTPPVLHLCESVRDPREYRLDQKDLEGRDLKSGDLLTVDKRPGKRPTNPRRGGEWVLFLSDAKARDSGHPYRAHVRRLSDEDGDKAVAVPDEVWQRFRTIALDTDDQRTARRNETRGRTTEPVVHEYRPKPGTSREVMVGHRDLAGPDLKQGQAVWVDVDDRKTVTDLGLAMIWRHQGRGAAGERAVGFEPCFSHEALCPSCRLFGSIDPTPAEEDRQAQQRAYRGHVRFGNAVVNGKVGKKSGTLPPMGSPRPGAGQFYLDNAGWEGKAGDSPLREWGSAADRPAPRKIRGRKHYWQTPERNGREKFRKDSHKADSGTDVELFDENNLLEAEITFTDIDEAQLGGLIAALRPSEAVQDPKARLHIGGGRPLGYGSCEVVIDPEASEVYTSGVRYGAPGRTLDLEKELPALVRRFRESVADVADELWCSIAKVLRPIGRDAGLVWYPPGAEWSRKGSKEFDEGFEFWKNSVGVRMEKTPDRLLRPLPHVNDGSQRLPIEGAEDSPAEGEE